MFVSIIKITLLLILWGFFFISQYKGFTYTKYPSLVGVYFLFLSFIAYYLNKCQIFSFIKNITIYHVVLLFMFILILFFVFFLVNKFLKKPKKILQRFPTQCNLTFEYRYILPKSTNILFQQIMIIIFISLLLKFINPEIVIIIMSFLFCILHYSMVIREGLKMGIIYMFFACLAGFLFSIIIINIENGIIYNIILHWLFYILFGMYYWIRYNLNPGYKF